MGVVFCLPQENQRSKKILPKSKLANWQTFDTDYRNKNGNVHDAFHHISAVPKQRGLGNGIFVQFNPWRHQRDHKRRGKLLKDVVLRKISGKRWTISKRARDVERQRCLLDINNWEVTWSNGINENLQYNITTRTFSSKSAPRYGPFVHRYTFFFLFGIVGLYFQIDNSLKQNK